MFSRKNRIPKEKLEEITKQSEFLGSDFFNTKYSKNNLDFPRFSIISSKKVCKSSVSRHLLKRRFVSLIKSKIKVFSNKDYVFFIKKEALNKSFKELETNFESFIIKNSL